MLYVPPRSGDGSFFFFFFFEGVDGAALLSEQDLCNSEC